MKTLVPAETILIMESFPYSVPQYRYGCDAEDRETLDSILYTLEDPDIPDGQSVLMDIDGLKEWYDQVVTEDDRSAYECPTVYDYLSCEIGRYVLPVRGVAYK